MEAMSWLRWSALGIGVLSALATAGCGEDGSGDGSDGSGGSASGTGGGDAGAGTGGGPVLPPPNFATRVARLTHAQYQNTIEDLFDIDDDVAKAFVPDALNGFAFDSSINLVVDSRLVEQYRTAAESLSARVVADDAVFSVVVPCDAAATDCADTFITSFGLRAFRRPLTSAEQERFGVLFDAGAELIESGDAFRDGVQVTVEAMLQSPDFLYREELGTATNAGGRILLSGHELASRISYFLYDSMPDEELFQAAAAGELATSDQVRAQVDRLLSEPATLARIVEFHEQAFDFERYSRISLDAETFPDAPTDLASRALTASRLFIEDIVQTGGGLAELLTAPYAFADAELAPLYGQEVAGDFERIDFDPAERVGLLSQVGFLASHAYSKKTDPIHRGLFVVRDLLCVPIPDPPPAASMTPPPAGSPVPETTRQEVEILTEQSGCINCHAVINPPGFAFEAFDAAGAARTEEEGTPVDTQGTLEIDGVDVAFSGPSQLLTAVAGSTAAHSCYLGKWVEFAQGRQLSDEELAWLAEVPANLAVLELLPLIASDESFMTRPASEVSP
jgi:hypothetical protein